MNEKGCFNCKYQSYYHGLTNGCSCDGKNTHGDLLNFGSRDRTKEQIMSSLGSSCKLWEQEETGEKVQFT